MKRYPHVARFCGLFLLSFCMVAASAQTRKETYLADGWRFSHTDSPECAQPQFDDSAWERVRVPHDWAIAGPFDRHIDMQTVAIEQNGEKVASEKTGRTDSLPWIGVGWYRTQFSVSKAVSNLFQSMRPESLYKGCRWFSKSSKDEKKGARW